MEHTLQEQQSCHHLLSTPGPVSSVNKHVPHTGNSFAHVKKISPQEEPRDMESDQIREDVVLQLREDRVDPPSPLAPQGTLLTPSSGSPPGRSESPREDVQRKDVEGQHFDASLRRQRPHLGRGRGGRRRGRRDGMAVSRYHRQNITELFPQRLGGTHNCTAPVIHSIAQQSDLSPPPCAFPRPPCECDQLRHALPQQLHIEFILLGRSDDVCLARRWMCGGRGGGGGGSSGLLRSTG
mmetsp:Transcript_4929/g.9862  ORF Transcript_4929/g.9862 Transcript_4929/m.9862 type:complete len:238 (-) Transcript_4929:78-791(-)